MSIDSHITKCKEFMLKMGLPIHGELIIDGNIHRYNYKSETSRNKKDEWYCGYPLDDGNVVVVFSSWNTERAPDKPYKWFSGSEKAIPEKAYEEIRRRVEEQQKTRKEETMNELTQVLSKTEVTEEHEYLSAKGIENFKVKVIEKQIIVSMQDINGDIVGAQMIAPDGGKKNWPGSSLAGSFHVIGSLSNGNPMIAEGYATGISAYQATGRPVIVAFGSSNVTRVAETLISQEGIKSIDLLQDNDAAGEKLAQDWEAKKLGAVYKPPSLKAGNDWNDAVNELGIEEVKKILWRIDSKVRRDALGAIAVKELLDKSDNLHFDPTILPGTLGRYVVALTKTTSCHPIMLATSVLCTASALLLDKIYFKESSMADGFFQRIYPNIWICNITSSGSLKSTAINKGAAALYRRQLNVDPKIREKEEQLFETMGSKSKQNIQDRARLTREIAELEKDTGMLQDRGTIEAFLSQLEHRTGCVFLPELSGWIKNLRDDGKNDNTAVLTNLYDVPEYYIHRTKTSGVTRIKRPKFSIYGVSTLSWMKEVVSKGDVDGGFFPRFMFYNVPRNNSNLPARPTGKKATVIHELEAFEETIEEFSKYVADYCKDGVMEYTFSEEGGHAFEEYHQKINDLASQFAKDDEDSVFYSFAARWQGHLLKLAIILQPFLSGEVGGNPIREVSAEAMGIAWAIVEPAIHSTGHLFGNVLANSEFENNCSNLKRWACQFWRSNGEWPTKKEILRSGVLGGGSRQYNEVLNTLIDRGELEEEGQFEVVLGG